MRKISTPSLGITRIVDESGWTYGETTYFNSLSRDHVIKLDFDRKPVSWRISTPSLGITPAYVIIPWAAKLKDFNSLSRDHCVVQSGVVENQIVG